MTSKNFRPIILAGGSGKRLWPLSTKKKPKQFLPLFGDISKHTEIWEFLKTKDKGPYLSMTLESVSI